LSRSRSPTRRRARSGPFGAVGRASRPQSRVGSSRHQLRSHASRPFTAASTAASNASVTRRAPIRRRSAGAALGVAHQRRHALQGRASATEVHQLEDRRIGATRRSCCRLITDSPRRNLLRSANAARASVTQSIWECCPTNDYRGEVTAAFAGRLRRPPWGRGKTFRKADSCRAILDAKAGRGRRRVKRNGRRGAGFTQTYC